LGVRAVIAQSYERIHRSNLVGMGILPLQFLPDQSPATLGLTGKETFDLTGLGEVLAEGFPRGKELTVRGARPDGSRLEFRATVGSVVAVTTIIGTAFVLVDALRRSSTCSPLPPGMPMSKMTASGGFRMAIITACIASRAIDNSNPLAFSTLESSWTVTWSSS